MTDTDKFDTVEAALNQLIDGNSDLVMETINESITYYSGLQQLSFGVLLIVAVIVDRGCYCCVLFSDQP